MRQTPWGQADGKEILAEGIISYTTPSHGGIWLSAKRQQQLQLAGISSTSSFLKTLEWWEEDCDWVIPYIVLSGAIRAYGTAFKFEENLQTAQKIAKTYHPEIYVCKP